MKRKRKIDSIVGGFNRNDFTDRMARILLEKSKKGTINEKTISSAYRNNVGGILHSNGFSFDSFSDKSLMKLAITNARTMEFVDFSEHKKMFALMNETMIVKFFIFTSNRLWDMLYEFDSKTYNSMDTKVGYKKPTFDVWLNESRDERKRLFYGLLDGMRNNPNTPPELLVELI